MKGMQSKYELGTLFLHIGNNQSKINRSMTMDIIINLHRWSKIGILMIIVCKNMNLNNLYLNFHLGRSR